MNKPLGFSKLNITIFIICAVTIFSGYSILKYYNNHDKDDTSSVDTSVPKSTQSREVTPDANIPQIPTKNLEDTNQANDNKITPDDAVKIIKAIVIKDGSPVKVAMDHIQLRDGHYYYVIRLYESMPDHSATLGWFYVETSTGKAFEWDLANDKLIPIN